MGIMRALDYLVGRCKVKSQNIHKVFVDTTESIESTEQCYLLSWLLLLLLYYRGVWGTCVPAQDNGAHPISVSYQTDREVKTK